MPSFDIVSEVDKQEIRNALEQANREISTRFDFKGSDARVELNGLTMSLFADDAFKLDQITDILHNKLVKRSINLKCLAPEEPQKISGNKVKQTVQIKTGIEAELAKKIGRTLKDSKLKIQSSIQGDSMRVSGTKRDTLQEAIALIKKTHTELPLQFANFRD
ncbi:MAG: YajQ family cyclic di-GMP-binding protein [Proteobacteria bacterium]|nr:YajQ family cyclic di-GMP-binding protein [Pseudomonadota bacterium]MDE3208398.1 YajQ family cyclic di-GMP-binding protein [Pseudomonadota bacterium]